jgi:predicted aspartyl protease
MKTFREPRALGTFLSLLLLCSGAIADSIPSQLPADVTMNKDAGRGNRLIVRLRLESGEEVPFFVDTGASGTFIDKSLEPKLGKRLGTGIGSHFGAKHKFGIYAAPKLYLGNTPLMTGSNIATGGFKLLSFISGRPIKGMLGMDCLRHYCIQLDFEAGKMRFLDAHHLNAAELGKPFRLTFRGNRPFIHHTDLLEATNTNPLIDTGFNSDGVVEKGAIKGHNSGTFLRRVRNFLVERIAIAFGRLLEVGTVRLPVRFPKCVWDGETYTDIKVGVGEHADLIGLRFLARHLVTMDFPNRTLYLKKTSTGPLVHKSTKAAKIGGKDDAGCEAKGVILAESRRRFGVGRVWIANQ